MIEIKEVRKIKKKRHPAKKFLEWLLDTLENSEWALTFVIALALGAIAFLAAMVLFHSHPGRWRYAIRWAILMMVLTVIAEALDMWRKRMD